MMGEFDRLANEAWDAVGPAFMGSACALFSLMVPAITYYDVYTLPPSLLAQVLAWTVVAVSWGLGIYCLWRWDRAIRRLREWRREHRR